MPASARLPQNAFYWLSQFAVAVYGRLPIFGPVRSAVGLVRHDDRWLTVARADRRGQCFPGGVAVPWESDEECLRREIKEETGLRVTHCHYLFEYFDRKFLPGSICVYQAEAEGELKASWEGDPSWISLEELAPHIFPPQHVILGYLAVCDGAKSRDLPALPPRFRGA